MWGRGCTFIFYDAFCDKDGNVTAEKWAVEHTNDLQGYLVIVEYADGKPHKLYKWCADPPTKVKPVERV